ncbi:MAG: FCD domain-containing protein [Gemmatimonas sp.]|nr:FCD domain-containing protein [Gemmatimonas sp.]
MGARSRRRDRWLDCERAEQCGLSRGAALTRADLLMTGGHTASDRAYEYIKTNIIFSRDYEGQFITEARIAERLKISRTPVREAIRRLAAEDLLQLIQNRGAMVLVPDPNDVRELLQAREVIERFAAQQLTRLDGSTTVDRLADVLEAHLEDERIAAEADDIEAFIASDRQFHVAIIEVMGNRYLRAAYDGLHDQHLRLGLRALTNPGRTAEVLQEHTTIVAVLRTGDSERFEAALVDHIRATLRQVLP